MIDQNDTERRRQAIIDLADRRLAGGLYPIPQAQSPQQGLGPFVDQLSRVSGGLFGAVVGGLAAVGLIAAWLTRDR